MLLAEMVSLGMVATVAHGMHAWRRPAADAGSHPASKADVFVHGSQSTSRSRKSLRKISLMKRGLVFRSYIPNSLPKSNRKAYGWVYHAAIGINRQIRNEKNYPYDKPVINRDVQVNGDTRHSARVAVPPCERKSGNGAVNALTSFVIPLRY